MQTIVPPVFYYHADAVSLGGHINNQPIPIPSSVALSSAGGVAEHEVKNPTSVNGVKIASAYTLATGEPIKDGSGWTQRVLSVVEGLDILGIVTADRLVAQIFVTQPSTHGGQRKVTFAGTDISNLRVKGTAVRLDFENSLVPPQTRNADAYNRTATFTPDVAWPALTELARRQNASLLASKTLPDWARHRYGWISAHSNTPGDYTLCSLVNQIGAFDGAQTFGHCIELPDFGRICVAEAVVFPHSAQLTLVRVELTGQHAAHPAVEQAAVAPTPAAAQPVALFNAAATGGGGGLNGQIGVGTTTTNGSTYPPS
jgi:hypothetical protein